MAKLTNHEDSVTRQILLQAGLNNFASRGYAATSVQQIVDDAKVSKPSLYYYFEDKAGLFEALVDQAHEEQYRLMLEAAVRGATLAAKLEEIVAVLFKFALEHQQLMRLAFATAFSAAGETPAQATCRSKSKRNFDFVREIIRQGWEAGELDERFDVDELAMGFYGQLTIYVMARLFLPEWPLDRQSARRLVELFLEGASRKR